VPELRAFPVRLTVVSRILSWLRRLPFNALWRQLPGWRSAAVLVPVAAIALGLAGYGIWWRVLADGVRETIMVLQNEQKVLGRNLDWNALRIDGFPYLVDATLSKARLMAPDIGTVWDGERVIIRLRPLSPGSIRVSLEGQQHFFHVLNGRWIEADMQADTALLSGRSRDASQTLSAKIERLTGKGKVDAADFHFILEKGGAGLVLNAAETQGGLPRLDLSMQVSNLVFQGQFALPLGPSLDQLDVDLGVHLPAQLPVATAEAILQAWRETQTPLVIRRFGFDWGGVHLSSAGEIRLDERGLPAGHLRLTIGNHSRLLEVLEAAGWITPETHKRAKPVLDVLAFVSGDPKRKVSVPLRLSGGDVYLGPARVLTLEVPPGAPGSLLP
jgi:hypothetical protein